MVLPAPPRTLALLAALAILSVGGTRAADLETGEDLFRTGKYDECAKLAEGEIRSGFWDSRWAS